MGRVGTVLAAAGVLGEAAVRTTRTTLARRWAGRRGTAAHLSVRPGRAGGDPGRWQVVTIGRPPDEILPGGEWPEPLRRLDGAVRVELRRAPGGQGTELAARPLPGVTPPGLAAHLVGDDPVPLIRQTLWQVKQLVEAGEVLRADRSPTDRTALPPG